MMFAVLLIAIAAGEVLFIAGYRCVHREEIDRAEHAAQLESYCAGLYYEGKPKPEKGDRE